MSIRAQLHRNRAWRLGTKAEAAANNTPTGGDDDSSDADLNPDAEKLHQKAIRSIKKAIKLEPNNPDDYYTLCWNLFSLGETENAIEARAKALEIDPNHQKSLQSLTNHDQWEAHRLGNLAREANKKARERNIGYSIANQLHEEAIEAIQRAIKICPDGPDQYYTLYWNLACLRKFDPAIEACEKGLSIDPVHLNCRRGLAYSYQHLKNHEKAIEEYRKLLDAGVDDLRFWQDMGSCLEFVSSSQNLSSDFDAAVERYPEDKDLLRARIYAYGNEGRWTEALEMAQALVDQDYEFGDCSVLEEVHKRLGQFDEAREVAWTRWERSTDQIIATLGFFRWYLGRGEVELAKDVLKEAAKSEDARGDELSVIGRAYQDIGDFTSAKVCFLRAHEASPKIPRFAARVAKMYRALGDDASALEYFGIAADAAFRTIGRREALFEREDSRQIERDHLLVRRMLNDKHHERAGYLLAAGNHKALATELDYLEQHATDLAADIRRRMG